MKTPRELAQKLIRQWDNAALRESRLRKEAEAWPVILSIGKPGAKVLRNDTGKVRDHFQTWREMSVGEVIWERASYQALPEPVEYPARWEIGNGDEWVKACRLARIISEYEIIQRLLRESDPVFHSLLIRRRTLWLDRAAEEVLLCLKVASGLGPGSAGGLPLRALPAAGNDSKFFERNEGFLLALLDIRYDGEASRVGLEAFLGASSGRGHWLLVSDLDGSLLPFEKLRVRSSELAEVALPGCRLVVVENESCHHQLPPMKDTLAVLGTGFDLGWLAAPWLRERKVAYWGDLDTWGLELLGRAREMVPGLTALLMNRELFEAHRDQAVVEPIPVGTSAQTALTASEREFFDWLRDQDRGRLEQEFLPREVVRAALAGWLSDGLQERL